MKRIMAFVLALATSALLFADITVKKTADGNAEVVFFYGNPRASEVLLAGNFTNWGDGAEPMEKTEKGFTLTKTFKATDEIIYKFISDGNWTADLKAPNLIDDGFGGKNSQAILAEMLGGDGGSAGGKGKISFQTWSMVGMQSKFSTQSENDPTTKGLDVDSVTFGVKSYNKFVGSFLPQCPIFVELCLAETDTDEGSITIDKNAKPIYLMQVDKDGNDVVKIEDGLKDFVKNVTSNLVSYAAQSTNNTENTEAPGGVGTPAYIGHLKFGFNTPYINFVTGFNYAKPDVRAAVTWTTVGGSSWDAGYQHAGGFTQFTLGDKLANAIDGVTLDIGFAPNKTADRKGTKYGYWGWAGAKIGELVVDFQSNGAYDSEYAFYDPVEHDFILGVKDELEVGDGKLSFAAQGLVATHQKSSDDLKADGASNVTDYFGYSTDVWYRTGDFDGIRNIAANAQVGYENDTFGANLEYRMRGAQASMLYVRENHDDATFDLSDQLGVLNSQAVNFNGFFNVNDMIKLNLGVKAEMALEGMDADNDYVKAYHSDAEGRQSWYGSRFGGDNDPLYEIESGAEFTFKPSVDLTLFDETVSLNVYGDLNYNAQNYYENIQYDGNHVRYDANEDAANYGASDSRFRFKKAGLSAAIKVEDNDLLKSINLFYGCDNANGARMLNSLVGQVNFAGDMTATLGFGLKTIKSTKKGDAFDEDANNPFAFAVGFSKKFQSFKKPTVYAQFVYNTDPFKHFGDGQDQLNIDRANIKGSCEKEGVGDIDAVDWYDGRAAVRCGIRWDI